MVSQIEEERTNENGECECLVQHHHQREQEKEQEQDHERRNRKTTTMFFNELERRRKDRKTGEPVQTRNKWSALVFGQFVALIATSMNATSYTLEYGMKKVFPMFLMFFSYTILSLHLCWSSSSTSSNQSSSSSVSEDEARYRIPFTNVKLRTPWYYYLCLSILDIGPNYLTLLAMTQTSFTSATLLGSLTIPSAMIFCNILLGKVYRPMHFVGVFLCMMGGSITILTDMGITSSSSSSSSDNNHPNSYTGDILAVVAAVGYG
jgi:solute carrier family 35 protein F1/2